MGFFKSFIKGAKKPIYAKRAEENRQSIGLNFALFAKKKIDLSTCISRVSLLTAEQVKYLIFNDLDKEQISKMGVIISAHLLAYSFEVLAKEGYMDKWIVDYFSEDGSKIIEDVLTNNEINKLQKKLYRNLFFKTLKQYSPVNNQVNFGTGNEKITYDLINHSREYSDGSMDEYAYLSGLNRDIYEKFKLAIINRT